MPAPAPQPSCPTSRSQARPALPRRASTPCTPGSSPLRPPTSPRWLWPSSWRANPRSTSPRVAPSPPRSPRPSSKPRWLARRLSSMSQQGQQVFNDRYELVRHIARGGMAQVYLARDLLLGRPVALKVLFPELSVDRSFVERFRREAQAAANLAHPNIVSVYDWGEGERTYFIVMEYVDGRTLAQRIREGAIDADEAAK